MHKNLEDLKNFSKNMQKIILLLLTVIFVGCAKSSSPSSSEIFVTVSPTIFNLTNVNLTTSSSVFPVNGTCSATAYGLEYSVDSGSTWTDVPGGCLSNGTYSLNVLVVQITNFAIRSKTQFAFTASATAKITLILPPNSPLMQFVAGSNSPVSSVTEPVMSFTMPWALSGERLELAGVNAIDTHVTGVVYGP